jgi:hypothetical protein
MILAIDPGNVQSAYVVMPLHESVIVDKGILPNDAMISLMLNTNVDVCVVEMVASYGMAVGKTIFETCVWIGKFSIISEMWCKTDVVLVYRKDIKMHLCGTMRAKDTNIMQALKDRYGEVGTKKNPGPLYGVSKDIWSALAVATYYQDTIGGQNEHR